MPKVSVIIPVYNVEDYLSRCIESVTSQTYHDLEVILVDDGSTDNSPSICDQWHKRDDRIKVIHKRNSGLSDARNVGLDAAVGQYVMFVDSDDFWMDSDQLDKLVEEFRRTPDCDFIQFIKNSYFEDKKTYKYGQLFSPESLNACNKDVLIEELVKTHNFELGAWCRIIKRNFLEKHHIRFIKGLYYEDTPWTMEIFDKADKIRVVNHRVYAYCHKNDGKSITSSVSRKKIDDMLWVIDKCTEYINHSSFPQQTRNALLSYMAYKLCTYVCSLHKIYDKGSIKIYRKKFAKYYDELLQYTLHPGVRLASIIYKIGGECLLYRALTLRGK